MTSSEAITQIMRAHIAPNPACPLIRSEALATNPIAMALQQEYRTRGDGWKDYT